MRAKPLFLAFAAIGLFAVMNVLIKHLSFYYDTMQVAFVRYLSAGLVALLWVWRMRPGWPAISAVEGNVLRGVLSLATGLSFFYALALLPLADAIALSFLAPVFMVIFSALILKETPGTRGIAAVALGFAGMLVMLWGKMDSDGHSLRGLAASVVSALTYALSMILLRRRAQKDPAELIVFFQSWIPALMIAPMAGTVWEPLDLQDIAPFAALGVLGVTAHVMMATAYRQAQATVLAPVEYTALIWAAILGVLFFAEVPTWRTLLGAALIMSGSLLTARR